MKILINASMKNKPINLGQKPEKRNTLLQKNNNHKFNKEKIRYKSRIESLNKNILYVIINFMILSLFISVSSIKFKKRKRYSQYSYITLKINSRGNISIYNVLIKKFCENLPPPPDEVLINDVNQSEIKPYYDFNKSQNIIKLVWKNNIKTAACMFYLCINITEMNLSHFNSSEITYMVSMFEKCTSLYSLELSNFDTSKVNNFGNMFDGCSSLTSLDLSSFITTSIVWMNSMFNACPLLEYIDLENSIINPNQTGGVFNRISENIIVCTKGEKWKEILNGYDLYINCFINKTENFHHKCYKKKFNQALSNKHICKKCGNIFHQKYNETYNNFFPILIAINILIIFI